MAELDLKGFITPREQPTLLYKLGEDLDAQKKAKAEAAKEEKARKAATGAAIETYFDPSLFKTETIEDANLYNHLTAIKQKAYQLALTPGVDINMIKMAVSPDMNKLTQAAFNIKEIDRQRKAGLEQIKGVKGINADQYNREFLQSTFLNPDGSLRNDIYALDPSKDYNSIVKTYGNIYNIDDAASEEIKNQGKSTDIRTVKVRGADGVLREVNKEIQTSASFVPDIKNGEFLGVTPKHDIAPSTDISNAVNQYMTGQTKEPIKLIDNNDYERLKNNPVIMGAINQATTKYASQLGRVPSPEEINTFQRAKLFEVFDRSAKTGFTHKTLEAKEAPITRVSVSVGGAGSKEPVVKDIYTPATNLWKEGQAKKDEASRLINTTNLSNEEIGNKVGLTASAVAATRAGRKDYVMPLNTEGLSSEYVNALVDQIQKGQTEEKKKKIGAETLAVKDNLDGTQTVYFSEDFSNPKDNPVQTIGTVDWRGILSKVQPGTPEKRKIAKGQPQQTKDPLGLFK